MGAMQHYSMYDQKNRNEIEAFIREQPSATLLTIDPKNGIHGGQFNPVLDGRQILTHHHIRDPQVTHMRTRGVADLVFYEYLGGIPSYWTDPQYGGFASMMYRHVQLTCRVKIHEGAEALALHLPKFLTHYQPEGGYEPLTANSEVYKDSYKMLVVAEHSIETVQTKWKVGQNKNAADREKVITGLLSRGRPNDLKLAYEIQKAANRS